MPSQDSCAGPVPLHLEGVSLRRGQRAILENVNLSLYRGLVALVGPNGSGKSTLLRSIATLLPVASGKISINGLDISTRRGADSARMHLSYLPQEPTALRHFAVEEACRYAGWLKGKSRRELDHHVKQVLSLLDLRATATKKIGTLSGGTQRRAYVAQALVSQPTVLLLDEPTAGLDPEHSQALREGLRTLCTDRLTVFSTHLLEDVAMADHVICLRDNGVRFFGTPHELERVGRETFAGTSGLHLAANFLGAL